MPFKMLCICFLFTLLFKSNAGEYLEECSNSLTNEIGICVPIKECPMMLEKIQQHLTEELIQLLRRAQCGLQGKDPLVCCKEDSVENLNIIEDHPNFSLFDTINCGRLSLTKVISGNRTGILQYKFMALIGYKLPNNKDNDIYYRCGGTLINPRYILTAAHCIKGMENRIGKIQLGEYDMDQDPDCEHAHNSKQMCAPPVKNVGFEELIPHPLYDFETLHYDIGLIRLNESIANDEHIEPICLPLGRERQGKTLQDGLMTIITGWGVTEAGRESSILLKAKVPIFSFNECKKIYPKRLKMSSSQICAGGMNDRADSCQGDSGGPLFIPLEPITTSRMFHIRLQLVQYGIVSFGPKQCGRFGVPAIYTKVAYFIDWILNTVRT